LGWLPPLQAIPAEAEEDLEIAEVSERLTTAVLDSGVDVVDSGDRGHRTL